MRQTDFTTALLDPNSPVPDDMIDPQGRPAGKRFDVYRNNVTASLSEALEQGFPVVQKLLGAESFKSLSLMFLRAHPPKSRAISQYGSELPEFLAGLAPLNAYPYLADVARIELALRQSYHAADATPLSAEGLTPEALMALTPKLAPATILLRSPHPALSIWRYNAEPEAPKPVAGAEDILITRAGFDPVPQLLPVGGLILAKSLDGTTPFGTALEAVMKAAPTTDIAALLTLFLSSCALTQ